MAGSTALGGLGAAGGRGGSRALTGWLGNITSASELALDDTAGTSNGLEVAAGVGDVTRGLHVESTSDVLQVGEVNPVYKYQFQSFLKSTRSGEKHTQ